MIKVPEASSQQFSCSWLDGAAVASVGGKHSSFQGSVCCFSC